MERLDLKKMLSTLNDSQLHEVKDIVNEIIFERIDTSKVVDFSILESSVLELKSIEKSYAWKANLKERGIETIGELIQIPYQDLMKFEVIGYKKIEQVHRELKDRYQIDVWLK